MADDATLTIRLDPQTAAQLTERAREQGVSPEQYAADLVAEGIEFDFEPPPELVISEEELRASIEEQMHQIDSGEAVLIPHEQVMAEARAMLQAAKASKK